MTVTLTLSVLILKGCGNVSYVLGVQYAENASASHTNQGHSLDLDTQHHVDQRYWCVRLIYLAFASRTCLISLCAFSSLRSDQDLGKYRSNDMTQLSYCLNEQINAIAIHTEILIHDTNVSGRAYPQRKIRQKRPLMASSYHVSWTTSALSQVTVCISLFCCLIDKFWALHKTL